MNEPICYAEEHDVELVQSLLNKSLFERIMLVLQLQSIAEEANGETPK